MCYSLLISEQQLYSNILGGKQTCGEGGIYCTFHWALKQTLDQVITLTLHVSLFQQIFYKANTVQWMCLIIYTLNFPSIFTATFLATVVCSLLLKFGFILFPCITWNISHSTVLSWLALCPSWLTFYPKIIFNCQDISHCIKTIH